MHGLWTGQFIHGRTCRSRGVASSEACPHNKRWKSALRNLNNSLRPAGPIYTIDYTFTACMHAIVQGAACQGNHHICASRKQKSGPIQIIKIHEESLTPAKACQKPCIDSWIAIVPLLTKIFPRGRPTAGVLPATALNRWQLCWNG